MKRRIVCLFAAIFASFLFGLTPLATVSAESNGGATILKDCDDKTDGKGNIYCLLDIVVDIFSAGVFALAVLGIIVVGIQYATAAGDVGKAETAKRRIFEIVIGLIAYFALFAVLKFLLPNVQTGSLPLLL